MSYTSACRLTDRSGRAARAQRIANILDDYSGQLLTKATLLDVGAAHGLITIALGKRVEFAIGIDVDRQGVTAAAAEAGGSSRAAFAIASGMCLPFKDECFDIVVCNHVYEHVPDARRLMDEILRVLKPGGACYFAGGHRLQLIEPHHRLPLLSWLPRPLADRYLQASGRGGSYEERFLAPWQMSGLFSGFADVRNVTGDVLRACARYGLGPRWLQSVFQVVLPSWLARLAGAVLPTYLWILRK